MKEPVKSVDLALLKLRGIGTDNASLVVGVSSGVYQKLKAEIPSLILIRCVLHSLELAVSAAATYSLPRNMKFLITETYSWFSRSSLRQAAYRGVYI